MLLIGTPCYNGDLKADYATMLLEMTTNLGIPFSPIFLSNESLISRARNNILSYFYANKQYSHLLFIDADMYISAQDIRRMWERHEDVIGAAVRLKADNVIYNLNPKVYPELISETNPTGAMYKCDGQLLEVDRVGTAVFMLSRKAVNDLVWDAKKQGKVYGSHSVLAGGTVIFPKVFYDVFGVGESEEDKQRYLATCDANFDNGQECLYYSEDYWACKTIKELGYKIWVDTTIKTRHNGTMGLENPMEPISEQQKKISQ